MDGPTSYINNYSYVKDWDVFLTEIKSNISEASSGNVVGNVETLRHLLALLRVSLKDSNETRGNIYQAAPGIINPLDLEPLEKIILHYPSEEISRFAVSSLGYLGGEDEIPFLSNMLQSNMYSFTYPVIVGGCLSAISNIGGPNAVEVFMETARKNESSQKIKGWALASLLDLVTRDMFTYQWTVDRITLPEKIDSFFIDLMKDPKMKDVAEMLYAQFEPYKKS